MHETAPLPCSGLIGRSIRRCLAVPRYLIRHPGRSLAVAALLAIIGTAIGLASAYLWASYHLRAARTALERYHNREAVPHLQDCLRIWSRDPETLLLAARAARRVGSLDEATRFLDQCQEVRGNEDEALLLERVLVRVERGELDSVINFCRSLIERDDPAAPLVLEALSKGYLRMYRANEAEKTLREWFERQPDNAAALLIQGQIYDLQTRQHDALTSYRRALTVDAELDEARLRLCNTLMSLSLTEEAQPHLEYLHRHFPDNLMVGVHLARTYELQGHTKEAENLIEAVLAREPHFAPALAARGRRAMDAGRNDEAEKWLREAATLEPGDRQVYYQLFQCLQRNGKPEEARKMEERRHKIEADLERILAISTVEMQRTPHDADLHYQVGTIALRAGSPAEGLRWLHSALQENPNHTNTHKALMEYYQRIGDFGRAREHRQKARLHSTDKANERRRADDGVSR